MVYLFLLSKLFDPDMAPFKIDQMYNFISERFEGTSSVVQEQALSWVHVNLFYSFLFYIKNMNLNFIIFRFYVN